MRHEVPERPQLGEHDGLAYALFLPEGEPTAGVVTLHGAGSTKENHFEFARLARDNDLAALCFDQRGHGGSRGDWGPAAFGDVLAMCDLLRRHVPVVGLRGSSMGGFCAIHAAALGGDVAGVVAVCPAPEDFLLRGLRSGTLTGFRVDAPAAERWLASLRLTDAVARLSPDTSLLLMHAEGDEQVPYAVSEELHGAAGEPKRLLLVPGGHHRSIQNDLELHSVAIRFVVAACRRWGERQRKR